MDGQRRCLAFVLVGFLCHCYCVMASVWPEGLYGLPMAKTGCPVEATLTWRTGWIFQDTEDTYPSNNKSASLHVEGLVLKSSVNRSFCMKVHTFGDNRRPSWPSGTYCIYQRTSTCPKVFRSGSVTWEDEFKNNRNKRKGFLPKTKNVGLTSVTKIFFCCRNDGLKTTPMVLPTASPFYLFAYDSDECQQVRWAVSTSEWIYYDTEDDDNGYDSVQNPAPFVVLQNSGHKIHYCYYTSCQYILGSSTGSFHSPRFPGNYANSQECSWKISVKASQIIRVHFVNFSLSDVNDELAFYDGSDESASYIATLNGNRTPRDLLSSSSSLFVVFRSNKVRSSSGFQASYTVIDTSTSTVPPITLTTTAKTTIMETSTMTTSTTATATQALTETTPRTDGPDTTSSSHDESTVPTSESSLPNGNSSKSYDTLKKSCIQQSQAPFIAVAIVIPLICIIAVIVMAAYLVFRLRNLRKKQSDVSVRYSPPSVENPSYVRDVDVVIEAASPSSTSANTRNNEYEDQNGDIYHEIENRQTTDNPLYQSTDTDKHVYASSFA